jgi:hypothetical protein
VCASAGASSPGWRRGGVGERRHAGLRFDQVYVAHGNAGCWCVQVCSVGADQSWRESSSVDAGVIAHPSWRESSSVESVAEMA